MDESEIEQIRNQFRAGQWPQFLEMIQINGLHGWSGQSINFNFPIVAIVGENGTGKSTLLKTAACAYEDFKSRESFYPSSFFVNTMWDRIQNVTMNYRIKQGESVKTIKISKPSRRWRFSQKRPERAVRYFDISRTLPLDATIGYAKIAKATTIETATTDINPEYRKRFSHVLGREYQTARFVTPDVDKKNDVGLLGLDFGEISQFHQGAGESATLDLIKSVQNIPEYTLVIIDEVENSLHPKAQRRIIRFLLWLCRQKKIQVILSTHSPYVLSELPQEARVLLLPGVIGLNILYGITPEFAMSRIDESFQPEAYIYVEDRESSIFLREILASDQIGQEIIPRIRICPVGPGNAVQMLGELAVDHKLPYKSLAFLDGDYSLHKGCVNLPGNLAPEKVVYEALRSKNWANLPDRFGIGAGNLLSWIEDAMLDPHHHRWNALIGDKIVKSATSVWEILASEWAKSCLDIFERNRVSQTILKLLDNN